MLDGIYTNIIICYVYITYSVTGNASFVHLNSLKIFNCYYTLYCISNEINVQLVQISLAVNFHTILIFFIAYTNFRIQFLEANLLFVEKWKFDEIYMVTQA